MSEEGGQFPWDKQQKNHITLSSYGTLELRVEIHWYALSWNGWQRDVQAQ